MYSLDRIIESIYLELERLGYSPVIIGTYALIIQGWLPPSYIYETKDVDIYIDEPMIIFDDRIVERVFALGLSMGRTESGGFYIDAGKPIEIIYPIHDFFVPKNLLKHVVKIKGMRVLEGHAALIAKALGSNIEYLAHAIKANGVKVDVRRLYILLRSISGEIDPSKYIVARRRVRIFVKKAL